MQQIEPTEDGSVQYVPTVFQVSLTFSLNCVSVPLNSYRNKFQTNFSTIMCVNYVLGIF
jgi:hypothetical protein